MQTNSTPLAAVAAVAAPVAPAPVAPVAAKPERKPRAKPVAGNPAAPAKPPVADTDARHAERIAAREAISAFYSGAGKSLPFKSASDTFAAVRLDKAPKAPTTRQAALLAAMLLAGDNIGRTGRFTRGGFQHDGRNVQPETGCLSDMLGRVISHVSGPLTGREARNAVFAVDLTKAETEIRAHIGDKLGKLALARIASLRKAA